MIFDIFTALLAEHCTGVVEVMGSNPIQAWMFSKLPKLCITAMINHVFISFSAFQTHYLLNIHLKTLSIMIFPGNGYKYFLSTCRRYHYYWILTDCVFFRVVAVLFKNCRGVNCWWSWTDWWFSCDVDSHRRNNELLIIYITIQSSMYNYNKIRW